MDPLLDRRLTRQEGRCNFFAPLTSDPIARSKLPLPLGRNYRVQTKQILNAHGNFCRAGVGTKENAGGGRLRRRSMDSKYTDTLLSHCLYCWTRVARRPASPWRSMERCQLKNSSTVSV